MALAPAYPGTAAGRTGDAAPSASCFYAVFHDSPILFAISSIDTGVYIEVNETFLHTLGFSRAEVIGHSSFSLDIWHESSERDRLVACLREHGSFRNEEVTIRKKSGEFFVGLFSGTIFDMGGDRLLFTLATDISDRKEAESDLLHMNALLEEMVEEQQQVICEEMGQQKRMKKELDRTQQVLIEQNRHSMTGQMVGNILHQWRQPLNSIGLLLQNLSLTAGSGSEMQARIDRTMQLVKYMNETAEVFRGFLRPNLIRTEFSIDGALSHAMQLFETMHGAENIPLRYEKNPEPMTVTGNCNEFCQAILNVLKNSRDVLLERQVPEPCIVLDLAKRGSRAAITISDNGGGIEPQVLDRIFDAYYTTKPAEHGTGIGLSITRTIIEERMGGKVTAGNAGTGARFVITVPCD